MFFYMPKILMVNYSCEKWQFLNLVLIEGGVLSIVIIFLCNRAYSGNNLQNHGRLFAHETLYTHICYLHCCDNYFVITKSNFQNQ